VHWGSIDAQRWSDPSEVFEFNPSTLALDPVPSPAILTSSPTYNCRVLLPPTGQAMLSATSDTSAYDLQIYTPTGGPQAAWRPHITDVERHLHRAHSYRLCARQLNGLSQARAHGDDQQMATNYPLVRLRGRSPGGDRYCRTFDHSTMGVATGNAIHHTRFEVPHNVPNGEYRLIVIANGIASENVDVPVEG